MSTEQVAMRPKPVLGSWSAALRAGLPLAAAGLLSRISFFFENSFSWIWLIWMSAFALAALLSRGRRRDAAVNLAGLAGVLLFCELFLTGGLASIGLASPAVEYNSHHPRGPGPVRNARIASRKVAGGAVVYDTVYSIDENGFRRTPPLPEASPAVLFLGDSITFGEGVNDDEAFPAVFQAQSGFKAINLAYSGYGPHQMLRLLETGGEIPATERYRPFQAFYLSIPDHILWAAGNSYWGPDGPRYEVDPGGLPRYRGPWRGRIAATAVRYFYQSAVMRWCWQHWPYAGDWEERDVERFAAVVAELKRVFSERYGGDFQVFLLWHRGTPIMEMLRRRGVAVTALTEAVPEFSRQELYLRHDGHPGPALHRALGLFLAEREVRKRETR